MKSVNIGELDRRIDLYNPTETVSDSGEPGRSFTLYKQTWAKVEATTGSENVTGDKITVTAEMSFVVRYDSGITELTRITYRSVDYNITHIEEIDRKVLMRLLASKPDNQ